MLPDLLRYARFSWELRAFLRRRVTLAEARQHVARCLREREPNFLRLARHGIYGHAGSPYLPLLRRAGCEYGDLEREVERRGLEPTLRQLRAEGVYFTFEEFKGRAPVERGGRTIAIRPGAFTNPHLGAYYYAQSGGSSGTGTRVAIDLEHLAQQAPLNLLTLAVHDLLDVPTIIWRGTLPDSTGVNNVLRPALFGHVPIRWFAPVTAAEMARKPWLARIATPYIVRLARCYGAPVPMPEPVPLSRAKVVAQVIAATQREHGRCLVRAHVSLALRISLAAAEAGLDLTGVTFMSGGEPPTPAKVAGITATGARFIPTYVFTEADQVGIACVAPADENDLHFCRHALALIQYPRAVPGSEAEVEAFSFTTLLPTAKQILLNVESDDFGTLEPSRCGCALEALGFTEHLRHVRSFSKLTGEGVTLVGSEMVRILEEVLPARFGGTPQDYQLAEEEDERGFTRLTLRVDPQVRLDDEAAIVEVLLQALGRGSVAADLSQSHWRQAGTVRVVRRPPVWTARGKLLPLHLARPRARR